MLLDIFDLCILTDKEAVYTVMFRILIAAVVYAASCNDYNIGILTDIEVIVNSFLKSAF